MRRQPTDVERRMWGLLKAHFPDGRFRRQVPIRHYVVDVASHRLRIVIEIDGGQHSDERDMVRSLAIEAEAYRNIHFWNNEVIENGEGCMIRLAHFLWPDHPNPTTASQQADKPAYPSPIEGEEWCRE